MEKFLDKKKEFIKEEITKEKLLHQPTITFQGYMSKSKALTQLSKKEKN